MCFSLEAAGIQHTLELLIEYIIDCKRWQEQRQRLPTTKMFGQHTQSNSHTAAPITSRWLSRCTYLETAGIDDNLVLFIDNIINCKRWQEQRQRLHPIIRMLAQQTRNQLTLLHLVQGKGCKGAHPWRQQASSTLLSFSLNIY